MPDRQYFTLADYAVLAKNSTYWKRSESGDKELLIGMLPSQSGLFVYMDKPKMYDGIWVQVETIDEHEIDSALLTPDEFQADLASARSLVRTYRRAMRQATANPTERAIARKINAAHRNIDDFLKMMSAKR